MKDFKLIPMLEFVLEQDKIEFIPETDNYANDRTVFSLMKLDRINNYANFLNKPLKLEMFVPCDEKGNVLKMAGSVPIFTHSLEYLESYRKSCLKVLFTNTQQVVYRGTRCLLVGKTRFSFNSFEAIFKNKKLYFFANNFELILKEEAFNRIFL